MFFSSTVHARWFVTTNVLFGPFLFFMFVDVPGETFRFWNRV